MARAALRRRSTASRAARASRSAARSRSVSSDSDSALGAGSNVARLPKLARFAGASARRARAAANAFASRSTSPSTARASLSVSANSSASGSTFRRERHRTFRNADANRNVASVASASSSRGLTAATTQVIASPPGRQRRVRRDNGASLRVTVCAGCRVFLSAFFVAVSTPFAAEDTASTSSRVESSARARSNPHSSTSVASLTSGASRAASSAPARVAASVFAGTPRRKRVSVTRATKCVVTGTFDATFDDGARVSRGFRSSSGSSADAPGVAACSSAPRSRRRIFSAESTRTRTGPVVFTMFALPVSCAHKSRARSPRTSTNDASTLVTAPVAISRSFSTRANSASTNRGSRPFAAREASAVCGIASSPRMACLAPAPEWPTANTPTLCPRHAASSAGTPTSAKRRARVCLCAAASADMSTPPFVRSNAPYTWSNANSSVFHVLASLTARRPLPSACTAQPEALGRDES